MTVRHPAIDISTLAVLAACGPVVVLGAGTRPDADALDLHRGWWLCTACGSESFTHATGVGAHGRNATRALRERAARHARRHAGDATIQRYRAAICAECYELDAEW